MEQVTLFLGGGGWCLGVRLHIPFGHGTNLPIPTPLQTCRSLMEAALYYKMLPVNNTEESHTIGLLSIQTDKCEIDGARNSNLSIFKTSLPNQTYQKYFGGFVSAVGPSSP